MKCKIGFYLPLVTILIIAVYWVWWTPGVKVASDFPIYSQQTLKTLIGLPQTWSEKYSDGLGIYTIFGLWAYPLSLFSGLLTHLGINFGLIEKVVFFIPFIALGISGMWILGNFFNFSSSAKFISTLFYMTNSYILLVMDGGQLSIGIAYCLFPWAYLAMNQATRADFKAKLMFGLVISIMGIFDIRFIYIFGTLSLLWLLWNFQRWKKWFYSWIVAVVTLVGLNSYWLLSLLQYPLSSSIYKSFTQISFTKLLDVGHPILLLAPHWYKNIFGNITPLLPEFIGIPILVFLTPLLKRKSKDVSFWMSVALAGIFLSKGATTPVAEVYPWLYQHVPGFSMFRDSTKFFVLVALSYSILIGITIQSIKKYQVWLTVFICCYLLSLVSPAWMGKMTGTLSVYVNYQAEYQRLANYLQNDLEYSRIFWIPSVQPLSYISPTHPAVEALRLMNLHPFEAGATSSYERFNFLREATVSGELLNILGVGYIAYPYLDPKRAVLDPDSIEYYYTFLNQLKKLTWIEGQVSESVIPLLKTKQHQDKFFVPQTVWWIVGSNGLNMKLKSNALIYSEEQIGLGKRLATIPGINVLLNKKSKIDLAANMLLENNLIFPARKLKYEPDSSGWWKRDTAETFFWKDFLHTKYGIFNRDFDLGGGWAVGEGNLKLIIKDLKFKKGEVLLIRVLESTRGGELKFSQGNDLIGTIKTDQPGDNLRWFKVNVLLNSKDLIIESTGKINVINALALVDQQKWQGLQRYAQELINRSGNNKISEGANVSYQQLNSTNYLVKVNNLKEPSLLVFSSTYDDYWRLDDQHPVPVYNLVNGFWIEKDGEYLVKYAPQKPISTGSIISITVLIFILGYLLSSKIPIRAS